ncbi:MAG: FG-GAP-like repeat-containing protein [candidate division WOR-3 bacterium]
MIFLFLSIGIKEPLNRETMDSLSIFSDREFIEKQIEVFALHPDHLRHFGPNRKSPLLRSRQKSVLQSYRKTRVGSVDTIRIAAIRVEFLPDTTSLTTGNGRFILIGSGNICDTTFDTTLIDGKVKIDTLITRNLTYDPPHDFTYFNRLLEALHNYYWKVSYNKLWLEWEVFPSQIDSGYQLPYEMSYYGDPKYFVLGFFKLLRDAVLCADNSVDFSDFDIVIVFHAGAPWQTDLRGDSPYDIYAGYGSEMHKVFGSYLIVDGDTIDEGIIMPETGFQDGVASYLQGSLCHEFGHALGLFDLYDVSGKSIGMGGWALMGTGNWNVGGLVPPRMCAYNRVKLGFDEPYLIDKNATSLPIKWTGSFDSSTPKIYKIPINAEEYFLIENRFAYVNPDTFHYVLPCTTNLDSNGYRVWKDNVLVNIDDYESSLPLPFNSGGLAIWHIDEEKIGIAESLNMVNVGSPKGIDLEEGDGIQDFEKSLSKIQNINAAFYGSQLDVYSLKGYNYEFSSKTDPSSCDNLGNWTGIIISNISSPDTIMFFDVFFNRIVSGFPKKFGDRMDVISPQDLNGSIYIGDMGGRIYRANPDDTLFKMCEIEDSIYKDSTYTTPLLSDITGDGEVEIFDMTIKGKIFLYDLYERKLLDSMRVRGEIYGNASAYDLLPGGGKEVLFGTSYGELHLLKWDGNKLLEAEGFPVYVGDWLVATPLVIGSSIYVLPASGVLLKISKEGKIIWRRGKECVSYSLSSPVAGDLDRDGIMEIICSTGAKKVFCVDTLGVIEWERNLPAKTYFSTPGLGDIDGDGFLEVVLADSANIFALNRNGALLNNFPIKIHFSTQPQSSIVLADVSGDSLLDIVFGSPDGGVFAFNGEGKKVAEFPFGVGKITYSTPLVCDMNGDGRSELFIGSSSGWLYGWETDGFYRKDGWNRIYFNNDHQSVFPDSFLPENFQKEKGIGIEEFYVYPSPIRRGEEAYIRFTLGSHSSNVIIRIYSLSGRLVTEKRIKGNSGQNEVRIDEELTKEANGIYVATINVDDKCFRKIKFGLLNRF